MLRRAIQFRFLVLFMGSILGCTVFLLPLVNAQKKYNITISTLEAAYNEEIQAVHTYMAYAKKAYSENYTNIAYLFVAIATSESIHARNFKTLMSELGVEVKEKPNRQFEVSSTKKNLKKATGVELNEIDTQYPKSIEKIKMEKCEAAIRTITYAWKSEKQHRDLIRKIQSATGIFFGLFTKKIEETPVQYFVCQECGSTLTELPKDNCPICKGPVLNYKKIKKIY